jgi:hypothetical protein
VQKIARAVFTNSPKRSRKLIASPQKETAMQKPHFTLSFGFLILLLLTDHSFAQSAQCGPRKAVLAALEQSYHEAAFAMGMAGGGALVEVFANLTTGSWSILATSPAQITCLVASGDHFETTFPKSGTAAKG